MSSLIVHAIRIIDQVHEIARDALHWSFVIARSHYENIDLATMSQGFMPGYFEAKLEKIEEAVAPLV